MANPSFSQLEDAATTAINRAMAARDSTEGVKSAVAANTTGQPLTDAVQRCIDAHAETITAANELGALVGKDKPDMAGAADRLLDAAKAAKTAADDLKNNQAKATTDTLTDKDKDAVEKADNARAVIRSQKKARGFWAGVLAYLPEIASVIVLVVGLFAVLWPLYNQSNLLDRIANVEYARGLLTYIIGLATVVIALLLALGALLGSEAQKDNFNRGKEVLTAFIGILGTILGFYYGSEKSQAGHLTISEGKVVRAKDDSSEVVDLLVTGGKPPYVYAFTSDADDIVPVKEQKSADGRIMETISAKKDAKLPAKLKLTFTVTDSANAKASSPVAESTPTPTPAPTATTPPAATPGS